jgi:hypothetical protein
MSEVDGSDEEALSSDGFTEEPSDYDGNSDEPSDNDSDSYHSPVMPWDHELPDIGAEALTDLMEHIEREMHSLMVQLHSLENAIPPDSDDEVLSGYGSDGPSFRELIREFEYDEGQDGFLLYALLELVEEKEQRIRHVLARLRRLEYAILTVCIPAGEVFALEHAA